MVGIRIVQMSLVATVITPTAITVHELHREVRSIDCFEFRDRAKRPWNEHPKPPTSAFLEPEVVEPIFSTHVAELVWQGLKIRFHLPTEVTSLARAGCLSMQAKILEGVSRCLLNGQRQQVNLCDNGTAIEMPAPAGRNHLSIDVTRHRVRTFAGLADGSGWAELLKEMAGIMQLHAIRLCSVQRIEAWLSRWRLMLDHLIAQILVVAVGDCLDALFTKRESNHCVLPDAFGMHSVFEAIPSKFASRFSPHVIGPVPQIFFTEIEGLRAEVLVALLRQLSSPRLSPSLLEIGVWNGITAKRVLSAQPTTPYFGVDNWEPTPMECGECPSNFMDHIQALAQENVAPYGGQLLKGFSEDAATAVPDASVDLIFVDGNHNFSFALTDILEFLPKVKDRGVLSGHDFTPLWFDVVVAVLATANLLGVDSVDISADGVWWLGPATNPAADNHDLRWLKATDADAACPRSTPWTNHPKTPENDTASWSCMALLKNPTEKFSSFAYDSSNVLAYDVQPSYVPQFGVLDTGAGLLRQALPASIFKPLQDAYREKRQKSCSTGQPVNPAECNRVISDEFLFNTCCCRFSKAPPDCFPPGETWNTCCAHKINMCNIENPAEHQKMTKRMMRAASAYDDWSSLAMFDHYANNLGRGVCRTNLSAAPEFNVAVERIRLLLQDWSGSELYSTNQNQVFPGSAIDYAPGSIVVPHIDTVDTHHISATLLLDAQGLAHGWPLEVAHWNRTVRRYSNTVAIYAQPGDLVAYQGARWEHSRPWPMDAKTDGSYGALVVHFKVVGTTLNYDELGEHIVRAYGNRQSFHIQ